MNVTIGEKIKQLRKEKRLTQENVHNNQSQISQIESGRISNPDENTLVLIAKNMEISFDELISDTNWVKPETVSLGKELAFSPAKFDIEIDDMLNITYSHKSYPLYNENGEKNEFCIYSGQALINKCSKCKRCITQVKQQFCSGCGNILFNLLIVDSKILNKLATPGLLNEFYTCEEVIEILVTRQSKEKSILTDMIEMATTKDKSLKDSLFKHYTNPPTGRPIGFDSEAAGDRKNQLTNIANSLLAGEEIKLEDLTDWQFNDQVYNAVIKKLKMSLKSMERPEENYDEVDQIKLALFRKVATQLQESLEDTEKTSKEEMMELLIDLSTTTDDSYEIIEKLQSKIDLKTESDEGSLDKRTLEDGNSETAAENETEQENNNAEKNEDKESKND